MDLEWLLDFLNGMVKPVLALVVLLIATLIILEDARSGGGNGLFGFQVETALALGATMTQATLQQVKRALVIAISPVLNSTKTVGLITVLGAMTGLIMGGASPLEASHIQIVIMIMLLGSATVSCIMSTYLCRPAFLSKANQLEVEVYSPD